MSIDVRTVDDERWNELLTDTNHPTGFHHAAALDVLERHTGATCRRLVGFKGEEPVGLFPVFTMREGARDGGGLPAAQPEAPVHGPPDARPAVAEAPAPRQA